MYNRYIPQPDGTYSRSRLPDSVPRPPQPPPQPIPQREEAPPPCPPRPSQRKTPLPRPTQPEYRKDQGCDPGILSFLRQLLPRPFDSGDLLVVMLLLLMCDERGKDQNLALLTLALYLFL